MKQFEEKLKKYIEENNIAAEQLLFDKSCHSVQEAADVVGVSADNFVINICLMDADNHLIVAIVKGEDRVSTSRVAKALNIEMVRSATKNEMLEITGYPFGGVPSFGYEATFIIDLRVMEKEIIYTGGGSPNALIRITSQDLLKANHGLLLRIRR